MVRAAKFDYSGQYVFVTGGSNGIGLAIAEAFRDAGASVTITGTKSNAAAYPADLSPFDYYQLDMADGDKIKELMAAQKRLDILVNCAGMAMGPVEYQDDQWARILDVNLTGTQRMSMAALPLLVATKGAVINIASMSSYAGFPGAPAYGASKTAIISLTKSLAMAWAGQGIRVNAIAPGWVDTNMTGPVQADQARNDAIVARTAMARWGKTAEMTGAVMFLCSNAAEFITGVTLPVDGGYAAA